MKNKKIIFTVLFIGTILLWISANINWGGDKPKWIVLADGKGYYAYLPAVFIYHDLNFGFFEEKEMSPSSDPKLFYDYRVYSNGHAINKCFCGTAIMQLPFFLAAHGIITLTGGTADGYSALYLIFVQIATIFYFLLGLYFLSKLLKLYDFKTSSVLTVLIAVTFGTNAFYYIVREAAMSHIYSFSLIAAFMYFSKKFFSNYKPALFILLSVLLGLIILVRPANGIVVFMLPFLTSSWYGFKRGLFTVFHKPWHLLTGVLIFLALVSIQLVIYKISTGSFFIDSYSEESFDFLHPHFIDFLFSYKKGAFLYTPLIFISLTGLYYFWKSSRYQFFSIVFFILFLFYILSSWGNWWYGGSFSSRVLIEYLPLFMVLLAATLESFSKKILKGIFIGIIAVLIMVNQIQVYQYRYGAIHYENMDKQMYWDEFLRIDKLL
ncbi:MAG TPA: hypothetical protein PKI01_04325 [Bacteroidales bacterium]|nr:hypothetical protein [Bacteroidales bacterium]